MQKTKTSLVREKDAAIRYILHPGRVVARDGDIHFISYKQLIALYKLEPSKCRNGDTLGNTSGMRLKECIHLYPREDGNYNLPEKQDDN